MNSTAEKIKNPQTLPSEPKFLIGIRINNQIKSQLYDPKGLNLRVGKSVIVNTDQGLKMGLVASNKIINFRKGKGETFYQVIRIANANDFQAENRRQKTEDNAKTLCSEKIIELKKHITIKSLEEFPMEISTASKLFTLFSSLST